MERASNDPLRELLVEAQRIVPVGSRWQHHKGGEYKAVGVGLREEDEHPCVIYSDGSLVWIRTLQNFLERVDEGRRFTRMDQD